MNERTRNFVGKWITSERFCDLPDRNVFHRQLDVASRPACDPELQNRHILFRRKFNLARPVRAMLYITADDYYKLYVNGAFVTQGPAAGYPFHYFYNEVDLSGFLRPGENTIAVHTFYQGLINRVWVSGDRRHGLLLDLVADGEETLLASDGSFRQHEHTAFSAVGKVGYDTQFLERYDAGAPEVGFESPEFDDAAWQPARIHRHADYRLFAQPSPRLEFEDIAPTEVKRAGNRWRIDFGALYVGSLRFRARGRRGDEIVMRFGQELNPDGTVRWKLRANCDYLEYFRLSGASDSLNQFDYKSFRYVELDVPDGCEVDAASFRLVARHAPFSLRAACNRDDEKSRAVWQLCVDTLHYGVQEVIQDCMEREKGYYLGDGCYSMLTYCLLTKDFAPMEKFIDDFLRTRFVNRGLMTCSACSFMQEIAEFPLILFFTLLAYVQLTGNLEFVRARYTAFADILDFYREEYAEADGLLNRLDKWCVVEWPANLRDGYDVDLTEGRRCDTKHNAINAYYLGAIKSLNRIAQLLGMKPYADVAPLEKAFVAAFYDPEKKLFRDSVASDHISMPGNVFAYFFELFPEAAGKRRMVEMVREKRLSQSLFFETFPLLCALIRDGEGALAHELVTDEDAWLHIIAEDGARTFEGWAKDLKWNTSLFHLTLACGAAFLTDWDIPGIFRFSE